MAAAQQAEFQHLPAGAPGAAVVGRCSLPARLLLLPLQGGSSRLLDLLIYLIYHNWIIGLYIIIG